MATDPSQIAKFPGRIACLLRSRLLGSPTRHPYFGELLYCHYESVYEPVKAAPARYACALLDPFAMIRDARQGPEGHVSPERGVVTDVLCAPVVFRLFPTPL